MCCEIICKFGYMMKRLFLIFTIFSSTLVFAQNEDAYVYGDNGSRGSTSSSSDWKITDPLDWERVTVGGGLGLQIGTVTLIQVAPRIGYYLTKNVLLGVGGNYSYYEERNSFSTTLYGGRIFAEYLFEDFPLFAHVESELINIESFPDQRINIYNFYVGGGVRQSLGGGSYIFILGLWNLNETQESRFTQPNPIIRGGIAIGL